MKNRKDSAWIEVSRKAVAHNLKIIRDQVGPEVLVAPCVKGNAYGHGLVGVARILVENGVNILSVGCLDEAAKLRQNGIKISLMILGGVAKFEIQKTIQLKVEPFVFDWETVLALQKLAKKAGQTVFIHIKIETGMNRLGFAFNDAFGFIKKTSQLSNVKIRSLATHLSTSEEANNSSVKVQVARFKDLKMKLERNGVKIPYYQCANSGAIFLHPESIFNLVRPGAAVFGLYPSPDVRQFLRSKGLELRPALSLKTRIIQIKNVGRGEGVGYGLTFKTKKAARLAVLPIGYFDGVDRGLSNRGYFLVGGKRCLILGNVCMNLTMIDVTDLAKVLVGEEAVFIGRQKKEEITVDEIAQQLGTINYEVVTRLRESLPRYYI